MTGIHGVCAESGRDQLLEVRGVEDRAEEGDRSLRTAGGVDRQVRRLFRRYSSAPQTPSPPSPETHRVKVDAVVNHFVDDAIVHDAALAADTETR